MNSIERQIYSEKEIDRMKGREKEIKINKQKKRQNYCKKDFSTSKP